MKKINKKINVAATLRAMAVGESLAFPATKYSSLKTTVSERGFQWGMSFSTSLNRELGTVTITRNS